VRHPHLHADAPPSAGSQGRAGLHGSVPRNRGKNTTLIASMTLRGAMGEAMAVEGSTKAFVFEAYVMWSTSSLRLLSKRAKLW
jgi:hypothetical protein